MKRGDLTWVAFVLVAAGAVPATCAARPKKSSALTPAAVQDNTGAAPASSITSIEGVVTGRYPYGTPKRLLVTGENGKEWVLMIDPTATAMSKGSKPATLADLQEGDRVKATYVEKHGESWARSLEVVLASPLTPTPAVAPSPASQASPVEKNDQPWSQQSLEVAPASPPPPPAPAGMTDVEPPAFPPMSAPPGTPETSQDQRPDATKNGAY